jgi:hypothetical protein
MLSIIKDFNSIPLRKVVRRCRILLSEGSMHRSKIATSTDWTIVQAMALEYAASGGGIYTMQLIDTKPCGEYKN